MTGLVRLKLYKGNIIVAGRKSPKSLYDPKIATMEGDASAYDQSDATGFIRLNALRLKLRAQGSHDETFSLKTERFAGTARNGWHSARCSIPCDTFYQANQTSNGVAVLA